MKLNYKLGIILATVGILVGATEPPKPAAPSREALLTAQRDAANTAVRYYTTKANLEQEIQGMLKTIQDTLNTHNTTINKLTEEFNKYCTSQAKVFNGNTVVCDAKPAPVKESK